MSSSSQATPEVTIEDVLAFMRPSDLAKRIGVTKQTMCDMRKRGSIPANRCASIEIATQGVFKRAQMRPDHFGELDYESNPAEIIRY